MGQDGVGEEGVMGETLEPVCSHHLGHLLGILRGRTWRLPTANQLPIHEYVEKAIVLEESKRLSTLAGEEGFGIQGPDCSCLRTGRSWSGLFASQCLFPVKRKG